VGETRKQGRYPFQRGYAKVPEGHRETTSQLLIVGFAGGVATDEAANVTRWMRGPDRGCCHWRGWKSPSSQQQPPRGQFTLWLSSQKLHRTPTSSDTIYLQNPHTTSSSKQLSYFLLAYLSHATSGPSTFAQCSHACCLSPHPTMSAVFSHTHEPTPSHRPT
jgi:hypothetical protein